jgi:hypothetical protein
MTTPGQVIEFSGQETLDRLRSVLETWPAEADRATKRALRKLTTWIRSRVLREVAKAAGVTQKVFRLLLRFRVTQKDTWLSVWVGTNDIAAHHLGSVRWTRKMAGARAGRRLFTGTWYWPEGKAVKTAGLIMHRTGQFGREPTNPISNRGARRSPPKPLEQIDKEAVAIHEAVAAAIQSLESEIADRFETLMRQELNYALNVENRRQ